MMWFRRRRSDDSTMDAARSAVAESEKDLTQVRSQRNEVDEVTRELSFLLQRNTFGKQAESIWQRRKV